MVFDELKNINDLTLPIAKHVAFEKIHAWLKGVKELVVDEDYLDDRYPRECHYSKTVGAFSPINRTDLETR